MLFDFVSKKLERKVPTYAGWVSASAKWFSSSCENTSAGSTLCVSQNLPVFPLQNVFQTIHMPVILEQIDAAAFFQCSFYSRPTCSHFCVHVTQSCREMSRDVKVLTDKYLWKVELLNSPCCHVNLRKRKSWKDWTQFFPCFLDQNDALHQLVYSWELSLWRMRSQSSPHRYHQSSGYSRILNKYFNSQWRLTDKVMHQGLSESFFKPLQKALVENEWRSHLIWVWCILIQTFHIWVLVSSNYGTSPQKESECGQKRKKGQTVWKYQIFEEEENRIFVLN